MTEEPTQQIRARADPKQATPPLPPGLDPTRGRRRDGQNTLGQPADGETAELASEATGVLHLDELFATEAGTERHIDRPSIEEAPTWTAMPIVPVRSEPYTQSTAAPTTTGSAAPGPTAPPPLLTGPPLAPKRTRGGAARAKSASATRARRLSTDLAAAKRRTGVMMMRTDTWMRRDDNALMLMTALIACLLILLVAAVGH